MKSWRVILICILMIYSPLAWAANSDETAAEAVQEYEIAGYRLRIPTGFLQNSEFPPEPDRVRVKLYSGQLVQLAVMYPGLAPIPFDLRPRLATEPAPTAYTRISIETVPGRTQSTWATTMAEKMRERSCKAEKVGDLCDHPYRVLNKHEAIFTGDGSDFVMCSKMGAVPIPHCKTQHVIVDGLFIEIFFDRSYLDFSQPIWARIHALICSWIDLPADQSLHVNRCRDLGVNNAD